MAIPSVAGEIVKGGTSSLGRAVVIEELCEPIATEKARHCVIQRERLASMYDTLQNCWVVRFFANDLCHRASMTKFGASSSLAVIGQPSQELSRISANVAWTREQRLPTVNAQRFPVPIRQS